MRKPIIALLAVAGLAMMTGAKASAFCGFYVAKADTKMFNRASKVVIARADNRTVISMANDYEGDPGAFAIVIPTPSILKESQINVAEPALIDHIDAYTAPRLVEYFDRNPCKARWMMRKSTSMPMALNDGSVQESAGARAKALGVTVEAEYTIGEYDIQMLSAKQSDGLLTFLTENGYKLPEGAAPVLRGYLKQGMKFFVAKVNLEKHAERNAKYLRPIQIAFESDMFMLPIRLGMLNADGEQELFVFTLTRKGRVETANYRTIPMPTGMDIPIHVKDKFDAFYRAMFKRQAEENRGVAFLEYAWDMGWCDPCAADPLSHEELQKLGVWWLPRISKPVVRPGQPIQPIPGRSLPRPIRPQAANVYVTRMHLRYTADTHPDDLAFKETDNRKNFQGRYVLRHPWMGGDQCEAATSYRQHLVSRWEKESQTLANLTGWSINDIRAKQPSIKDAGSSNPWWEQMWQKK